MTKTILVTGGGGFLGSHLCESLLAKGFYVIALDNFYSSSPENVLSLKSEPRFELIRHDVCFPFYFECDFIVNLACPASPVHYQRDPVQTLKTNVSGSINALGMAKRLKIPICKHRPQKFMGIPKNIRKRNATGVTSIQLDLGLVTMKASAAPKHYSWTTTDSIP